MKRVEIDPIVEALEQIPYGLFIIGARNGDRSDLNGMMADWVTQLSFQPRLIGISFENNSTTLRFIKESGAFTVNLLGAGDRDLAAKFCQPRDASKIQGRSEEMQQVVYKKFEGIDFWDGDETGCPVLSEAMMWLECELHDTIAVGDHTLVVGRVIDGAVQKEAEPLTSRILGWSYAG
jgi:flavin reductase (DIM6/NTAB) family NADH-FMN oxidoreductase RutF